MTITNSFRQSAEPIIEAILRHPFNRELASGKLTHNRFVYYLQQDELYLRDYARALALAAAKAPDAAAANDLLTFAREGIWVEQELHHHFFKKFNVVPADEQQPACFTYCRFLLSTCAIEPCELGLAALLPCFWIYRDVGLAVAQASSVGNPYQAWIDVYTDASFEKEVERMIELTEAAAAHAPENVRTQMSRLFHDSTRLEWHFWDAAYHLEEWPPF
jgi:thiaminase (transcriptional activator TenA)